MSMFCLKVRRIQAIYTHYHIKKKERKRLKISKKSIIRPIQLGRYNFSNPTLLTYLKRQLGIVSISQNIIFKKRKK